MFTELLKPILRNVHPCSIEEVRHNIQKERRIIDTLEPVMNSHRLILDPSVIREDFRSAQSYSIEQQSRYMMMFQLSRITGDRGSLLHDDRLDALAIAVNYWTEQMAQDADDNISGRREELLDKELRRFVESVHGSAPDRGPRWMET